MDHQHHQGNPYSTASAAMPLMKDKEHHTSTEKRVADTVASTTTLTVGVITTSPDNTLPPQWTLNTLTARQSTGWTSK